MAELGETVKHRRGDSVAGLFKRHCFRDRGEKGPNLSGTAALQVVSDAAREPLDGDRPLMHHLSFIDALSRTTSRMSAGTYLETAVIVDANRDPVLSRRLDDLLAASRIEIVSTTASLAEIARRAYRDFGKGTGHAAALDFGDCFAYALARESDEPLLFKGDDFGHTDIASAL